MDAGGIRKDDRDLYAVVIVMPEELLFKRGESAVEPKGQAYLGRMVPILSGIVCSELRDKVACKLLLKAIQTTCGRVSPGRN